MESAASNSRNANVTRCYNGRFMLDLLLALLAAGRVFFRSRADTALEVLALRQQVAVLKRKHPRPAVNRFDRGVVDMAPTSLASVEGCSDHCEAARPSSAGIAQVSAFTGAGDPGLIAVGPK